MPVYVERGTGAASPLQLPFGIIYIIGDISLKHYTLVRLGKYLKEWRHSIIYIYICLKLKLYLYHHGTT